MNDFQSMYLELQTLEQDSGRKKRNAPEKCTIGDGEKRCCLYDLEIDFEAAGWDFVIAPKRYNAQMCNGECRLGELAQFPHTKFASQAMAAKKEAVTAANDDDDDEANTVINAVGPCCHPTEYDSITLIYMTEQREVLISKVSGMIARRCGCA